MLLHLLLLHLEYKNSSVINFVHLVINGCNLAGIRYKSYQEGAFYYIDCKGTITTDYQRKRLKEFERCLCPVQRQFQSFTLGTFGG